MSNARIAKALSDGLVSELAGYVATDQEDMGDPYGGTDHDGLIPDVLEFLEAVQSAAGGPAAPVQEIERRLDAATAPEPATPARDPAQRLRELRG